MEGKEPILTREELIRERKKIITNLVLLMSAAFVVLLALGTMAWFRMNKNLESSGLSVSMSVPEMIQISLGKTNGSVQNPIFLNDAESLLVSENGVVLEPRTDAQGNEEIYDWIQWIDISNYYAFGRLFPASSDSGEHILFTPDGADTGRNLKTNARFYQADGYKDADLMLAAKNITSDDQNSLMATAYPFQTADEKSSEDFGGKYVKSRAWYDTNDDGYFVDIPIWLRTNYKNPEGVALAVEGYITQKDGQILDDDEEALYKAVRIAILKEDELGALIPAAEGAMAGADPTGNLIPLMNADAFGTNGASIMDSENYTIARKGDMDNPTAYYGLHQTNANGIVQTENYQQYHAYDGTVSVITLGSAGDKEWSEKKKYWLRIWLDGDDKDCWNATAGQDWKIHLRFFVLP